jgi:hypothetical protein
MESIEQIAEPATWEKCKTVGEFIGIQVTAVPSHEPDGSMQDEYHSIDATSPLSVKCLFRGYTESDAWLALGLHESRDALAPVIQKIVQRKVTALKLGRTSAIIMAESKDIPTWAKDGNLESYGELFTQALVLFSFMTPAQLFEAAYRTIKEMEKEGEK